MSPAERLLWQRVQRRAAMLTPELAAALLVAFATIRDGLDEAEVARLVEIGAIDRIIGALVSDVLLSAAFQPVREEIRRGIATSFKYFVRDLPIAPPGGRTLTIGFDFLNPRVIDAVRSLETKVVDKMKADVKETVRAFVENGLRDGVNPRVIGRQIRSVIGLAPNQEQEVRNFRRALEGLDGRNPLDYQRRDKRFDGTIAKARSGEKPLTPEQIDKMVEIYRKRRIALNAETNARTAALDSQKLGQRLSWEDALAKGIVDRDRLFMRWVGVMDARERQAHRAMEGETVQFDEAFSNGETTPGGEDFNCRCIGRYFLAAPGVDARRSASANAA